MYPQNSKFLIFFLDFSFFFFVYSALACFRFFKISNIASRTTNIFKTYTFAAPLRFLDMTPSNDSVVASGSEVRCAVEGFPKPSLTMLIGYTAKKGRPIYFARVLGSKTTVTGEEIRYNLALRAAPSNADVLVVCRASQGEDSKELRHVFRRSPEDVF